VVIFVIIAAVMLVMERKTVLGRWTIASGGNQEAANLSGIPVNRTRVILYIVSGLAAGIAGILINSRVATGDPTSGAGFEFDVIVAVVLAGQRLPEVKDQSSGRLSVCSSSAYSTTASTCWVSQPSTRASSRCSTDLRVGIDESSVVHGVHPRR